MEEIKSDHSHRLRTYASDNLIDQQLKSKALVVKPQAFEAHKDIIVGGQGNL